MKDYYKPSEIGKFLNVRKETVINWINDKKLSAFTTAGGHFRVTREDLVKFMKEMGIKNPEEDTKKKYRILIVEDGKNVAESIRWALDDIGFECEIDFAYTYSEAMLKVTRYVHDLIILDVKLGDIDADDIVKTIKNDNKLRSTKILVYTGYKDKGKRMMRLRVDKLIIKSSPESDVDNFRKEVSKLLGIKLWKLSKVDKKKIRRKIK